MNFLIKEYHRVDYIINKYKAKCYLWIIRHFSGKTRIFMMNIPEHANMGDQAIVLAEKMYFMKYFNVRYYEVSDKQWKGAADDFRRTIKPQDIICIHGGGYIGDIWPGAERMAKQIIDSFPDNKVILMPNTIHFYGDDICKINSRLSYYDKENLFLFLRDQSSYEMAKKAGVKNIALVPDTVSFMVKNKAKRCDNFEALLCMRDDIEKAAEIKVVNSLINILSKYGVSIKYIDTVNKHGVRWFNRSLCVNRKIAEFQKARIVITDRLHGMYFAAITGTPCIALDNISKKVSGGAYWLKDLSYVRVYDNNLYEMETFVKQAIANCNWCYSKGQRLKMFDMEADIIKSFCGLKK